VGYLDGVPAFRIAGGESTARRDAVSREFATEVKHRQRDVGVVLRGETDRRGRQNGPRDHDIHGTASREKWGRWRRFFRWRGITAVAMLTS